MGIYLVSANQLQKRQFINQPLTEHTSFFTNIFSRFQIVDGNAKTDVSNRREPGSFCGEAEQPQTFISETSYVKILFHTDNFTDQVRYFLHRFRNKFIPSQIYLVSILASVPTFLSDSDQLLLEFVEWYLSAQGKNQEREGRQRKTHLNCIKQNFGFVNSIKPINFRNSIQISRNRKSFKKQHEKHKMYVVNSFLSSICVSVFRHRIIIASPLPFVCTYMKPLNWICWFGSGTTCRCFLLLRRLTSASCSTSANQPAHTNVVSFH